VTARPGANLTYLVVRHGRGPLDDPRVRQGLALAIDRVTLAATLFGGHAKPAGGIIPPLHWASFGEAAPLAYDPTAARTMLDIAAVKDPPGPEPRFRATLLVSTDRQRVSLARVLAQELGDVGVEIEVIPLELGTMIARLNAGDFELALLQLPEFTEPHLLRHFFHSEFVPPVGGNRGRVADRRLDALLDQGGSVPIPEARRTIYALVEARMLEQMHAIPLFHEDQVVVTSARARGFAPSAEGRWLSVASLE
jgi:peptide/nickel transport system substrate-binding protein